MKIKSILLCLFLLPASFSSRAQEVQLPVGTVIYSLPSTTIAIRVTAERESFIAGPYAGYAQKYLGSPARLADATSFNIKEVTVKPLIEADLTQTYSLNASIKDASSSALVKLSSQGLVVFADTYSYKSDNWRFPAEPSDGTFDRSDRGENLTSATTTLYKRVRDGEGFSRIAVQQSEVVEKSPEKKAAEAAQRIFDLRKKRLQIITGDTDATYSGEAMGAAIAEMTRLEQEYLSLFYGISETSLQTMNFDVVPSRAEGRQTYVAFRISDTEGLLPADSSDGRPIVLDISSQRGFNAEEFNAVAGNKVKKTINYRIPATATVRLLDGSKMLIQSRLPIYQLGTRVTVNF